VDPMTFLTFIPSPSKRRQVRPETGPFGHNEMGRLPAVQGIDTIGQPAPSPHSRTGGA
jgi:hypothetical protein